MIAALLKAGNRAGASRVLAAQTEEDLKDSLTKLLVVDRAATGDDDGALDLVERMKFPHERAEALYQIAQALARREAAARAKPEQ
jgi:hypothetical protein